MSEPHAPSLKPVDRAVHFPFSPLRFPFFYGWVIMVAGIVATLGSIPGQTMAVGVFKESFIRVLSLPEIYLSTAYMIGTIASSFLLPFAGKTLDRIGARSFVVYAALGLGGSLFLLAAVDKLVLGADRLLSNFAASFLCITGCYFLLRFFGQGCLTLVARFVLGKWFHHRRGLAVGISGVFISFGFSAAPGFINDLLQEVGWRDSLMILALFSGPLMAALGWLFFRDNPEECGLKPDGITDENKLDKLREKVPDIFRDLTRKEALKTLAFWVFSAAMGLHALALTAIIFHIASMAEAQGVTRDAVYALFLPTAVVSVSSNFLSAWLSDRIKLNWMVYAMMGGMGTGLVGAFSLSTPLGPVYYVAGMGVAGGIFGMLLTVPWPRYFGTKHLGAISGLTTSVVVFASAIGPMLFSAGKAWTGNYDMMTFLLIACPALVMVLALFMENPQRRYARQGAKQKGGA